MKTADQIFDKKARQRKEVEVAEWGVTLRVRPLSFDRMMALSKEAQIHEDDRMTYDKDVIVTTIIECCLDQNNEQFFQEHHREHLLQEDFPVVLNLFKDIMKSAASKEEAEKN